MAMIKQFAPEVSAQVFPEIYEMRMTLREGVRQMLGAIPSERYSEIIEFSQTKEIRRRFVELLNFLDAEGIKCVVVSGGIRIMVETVLGDLVHRVEAIYAVDIITDGDFLQVHSDFEGDRELMAKVQVMNLYDASEKIAIGDSVTDLNMGLQASLVFARDRQAKYLDERQKPYIYWHDFFDVRQHLAHLWACSSSEEKD